MEYLISQLAYIDSVIYRALRYSYLMHNLLLSFARHYVHLTPSTKSPRTPFVMPLAVQQLYRVLLV